MSSEQKKGNLPLLIVVIFLAMIFAAGAWALYSGWSFAPAVHEPAEFSAPETETAAILTTATASEAPRTTTTAVTTTAPDPHAAYLSYLEKTLVPEFGCADTSGPVTCSAHSGIAGVFFDDLRGSGTDDMVVIRLDITDGTTAALPVLLWYGDEDGEITLLDTFEIKPQWSAYCIRYADKSLYLSGEFLGDQGDPEVWRFTEMQLDFLPEPDLMLQNMEQETAEKRPEPMYPENAVLLLEMQLDTAQPISPLTERQYLLRNYTDRQAAQLLG